MKKKCSLTVFDGDKALHGTAAQLKHISDQGGWDCFLENYVEFAVKEFVKQARQAYNEEASRPKLKLVEK